ncbi:TonB-dependent receptor [Flavobacteriaceae bacterium]|nr:TonB-dependent receptor [Flavobacteriaceae bacterium]
MKQIYLIITFSLMSLFGLSQTMELSGNISDVSGLPLPGVTIIQVSTNNGAISDFDGYFIIKGIEIGDQLKFSYLGYKEKTITIKTKNSLVVILDEDQESLDEVVIVGYGTQTKKAITGAVSVVSSQTIEELAPTRIEQALQGQVAGVNITTQSGAPGSASNIRIRGISTNGDNRPLILLDGNVIEDLSVVTPSDIENITVLKDATAGIYGVRAANGVILITTKAGVKNSELKLDVNLYGGFQQTTRTLPALNASEYGLLVNEAHVANGEAIVFPNISNLGGGTNWQNEVFQDAAIINQDFTLRGGTKNSGFAIGSSYLTQDGIIGGGKSNFTRYNVRLNFNTELFKNLNLKAGLIYTGTNRKALSENAIGSVLFNALNNAPTLTVKDGNNQYTLSEGLGNEVINPIAQIANTYNKTAVDKLSGNFGGNYKFLKNFSVESNIQFNYAEVRGEVFNPVAFYGSGKVFNKDRSEYSESKSVFQDYTFDAILNYEKVFNEAHNLKATIGTSVFKTEGEFSGSIGFDIPDNDYNNASLDNASDILNFYPLGDPTFDSRLLSYFGRIQYNFKEKYLFSALIRRDGSTKFGPENRFGYFPTASLGWVLSDESFLEEASAISFLKLRTSYGILGNDRIPDYRYVSILNGEGEYVLNGELVTGIALGTLSNPEIKWEQQESFNVGVDARFLNNELTFTADYFSRNTKDLLLVPDISGILGGTAPGSGAPIINGGDVKNTGFEFQIGYSKSYSDNMSFNVNYNFTTLENEVLKVDNSLGYISGGGFGIGQSDVARMEVGMPIGYFHGLKTDGVFQNQSEVDAHPSQLALGANAQPGDIRFVDINNDGLINEDDKTYIGDPIPDVTMGLNISFDYKNFDFQMYLFSSIGNEIVRNYERNLSLTNKTSYELERWTGPGTSNSVPRATTGATSNAVFSDYFVEDASYVRAQNLQIGYTLDKNSTKKIGVEKLRFYASVSNVFTLTKYRGYDPTSSTGNPLGGGFDNGFYPTPRTFLLGVNFKM